MSDLESKKQGWLAFVERALKHGAAVFGDSVVSTRDALFALWTAADRAPGPIRDLYREFDEDKLVREADQLPTKSLFTGLPLAVGSIPECRGLLFALAVRVRYLEAMLHEIASDIPLRSENDCLAKFGTDEAFILLRKPRHRTAKTKQSFRRRGLKVSRVLPRRIDSYRVKLLLPDDPWGRARAASPGDLGFGTGLFKDLRFLVEHDANGFFIEGVKVPDQIETIRSQVIEASRSGCSGVVYPELTISRDSLLEIQNRLGNGDWICELSLIIAGSRHETIDSKRYNVCSILNAYGAEIGQHRKLYQYSEGSKPAESIELGDELQILVLPDAMFAFGICLDFCNTSEDPPYADLDVDYVLVPSCGNDTTMQGHIQRASEYLQKQKTRTLVVQQFYADEAKTNDPLGYVLARVSGEAPRVSEIKSSEIWAIYNI